MRLLYVNPVHTGLFRAPFVYFQTTNGMGLLLWQITVANLSLITNDINLK